MAKSECERCHNGDAQTTLWLDWNEFLLVCLKCAHEEGRHDKCYAWMSCQQDTKDKEISA